MATDILLRTVPALWVGMIVAISVIETPLKFRAPGISLEDGLGIGRLVFHALNSVELVLALLLVFALVAGRARYAGMVRWSIVVAIVILLVQVVVLRPVLDDRLDARIAGIALDDSLFHIYYIGGEMAKVAALATAAITAAVASSCMTSPIELTSPPSSTISTRAHSGTSCSATCS
jgi:hypothetical protein